MLCQSKPDRNTLPTQVMFLNINRKITSVVTGSVQAFDAEGSELYWTVTGSVQAFDAEGSELYWTVTGDNVSALAFCDVDDDGQPELICGTEDFEIRAFKNVVLRIEALQKARFAYAWLGSIDCFDLDNDGVPELIAGPCHAPFARSVAALVHADYRLDGRETLMSSSGAEHSGLASGPAAAEAKENEMWRELTAQKAKLTQGSGNREELASYQEQLKQYKSGGKETGQGIIPTDTKLPRDQNIEVQSGTSYGETQMSKYLDPPATTWETGQGIIPTDTHLMTSNYSVIRAVVIFAEHLFDGEACMLHPLPPSNNIIVQISPAKVQTTMNIKAMTGVTVSSLQYHVFELNYVMPKFAMLFGILRVPTQYHLVEEVAQWPTGAVTFVVQERPNRIWSWLQRSFISIPEQMPVAPQTGSRSMACLFNLRASLSMCL
ncbi:Bardet-Biedl syndrome 2 protein-like [Symbiodinium microadriaticum]|uniref:Bardet-Biedl syndrome 2 protein-like n=1 Tax=Symbiodinium microadriaticum TaxID=2951 RepID=A0A1Q9DPP6_SYMMI|nr:Bardet-Biedl syndrome 2 protein-like [Symbiodinium microadriaticum]